MAAVPWASSMSTTCCAPGSASGPRSLAELSDLRQIPLPARSRSPSALTLWRQRRAAQAARRRRGGYSRMVFVLRLLLPTAAAGLIAVVALWSQFGIEENRFRFGVA